MSLLYFYWHDIIYGSSRRNLCDVILDICLQTKDYVMVFCEIPPFPTSSKLRSPWIPEVWLWAIIRDSLWNLKKWPQGADAQSESLGSWTNNSYKSILSVGLRGWHLLVLPRELPYQWLHTFHQKLHSLSHSFDVKNKIPQCNSIFTTKLVSELWPRLQLRLMHLLED